MKRLTLALVFSVVFSYSNVLAQELSVNQPSQVAIDKARDFVLNSKVIPDFNNSKDWLGPSDSGLNFVTVANGTSNQLTETDQRSWVRSYLWRLQIVFRTRDYLTNDGGLVARVYSFWNGQTFEDVSMYYGVNTEEGEGRMAALIGGGWYINDSLFDDTNRNTDIKPADIQFDPQTSEPLSVMFTFQTAEGTKELTLKFPKVYN